MTAASRFPQLPVPHLAAALAIAMPTLVAWCAPTWADSPQQLRVEQVKQPAGWKILVGDDVFAGYRFDEGGKPIVYPVIGPGGQGILFAANPFGIHHFDGGPQRTGIVLREGTRLRLNYRVVLHTGLLDIAAAKTDAEQYANEPRPEME